MGSRLNQADSNNAKGMTVTTIGRAHRAVNMSPDMNAQFIQFMDELEEKDDVNADKVNPNAVLKLMVVYCLTHEAAAEFVAKNLSSVI